MLFCFYYLGNLANVLASITYTTQAGSTASFPVQRNLLQTKSKQANYIENVKTRQIEGRAEN